MARGTKRVRTKGDSPQHVAWVDAVRVRRRVLHAGVYRDRLTFALCMPVSERAAYADCYAEAARESGPYATRIHRGPNGSLDVLITVKGSAPACEARVSQVTH